MATMKAKKTKEMEWRCRAPLYISKKDKRYKKYVNQLKKRGFSDTETWCLFSVVSEFVLPRLKRFREINNGYPANLTEEKWNEIIDSMILAFELCIKDDNGDFMKNEDREKVEQGLKLFGEYFQHLWW